MEKDATKKPAESKQKIIFRGLARGISLAMALGLSGLIFIYPHLFGREISAFEHSILPILFFAIAGNIIYGIGYRPKLKSLCLIFSPVIAWPLMLLCLLMLFFPMGLDPRAKDNGASLSHGEGSSLDGQQAVNLGGDFRLTMHDGKVKMLGDLPGRYRLIYFGFTHCPDVCPNSLLEMTRLLQVLEKENPEKTADVTPVFISLDPERDTAEAINLYKENFHPRFAMFTGTTAEIDAVKQQYRVYSKKVELPDSALKYTVDHSSIIYLTDAQGRYIANFSHHQPFDMMLEQMREQIF